MTLRLYVPKVDRRWVVRARATVSGAGAVIVAVLLEQSKWNSSTSLRRFHDFAPSWPIVSVVLLAAAALMISPRTRMYGYAIAALADACAATSLLIVSLDASHTNGWVVVAFYQTAIFQGFGVLTAIQDRGGAQGGE